MVQCTGLNLLMAMASLCAADVWGEMRHKETFTCGCPAVSQFPPALKATSPFCHFSGRSSERLLLVPSPRHPWAWLAPDGSLSLLRGSSSHQPLGYSDLHSIPSLGRATLLCLHLWPPHTGVLCLRVIFINVTCSEHPPTGPAPFLLLLWSGDRGLSFR